MADKGWILFFFAIMALWAVVLTSTLYPYVYGTEILVNREIDLTYFTLPILGFNLIYVFMLILIFALYLGTYGRVRKYQIRMKKNATERFRTQSELCSIIIPARNEESVIKRTVLNCLQQTYQNIEVIVVAHNCSDRTFEEAKVEDPRVKVFRLDTKEAGKGIALNFAVSKSTGNYILVLDSDGILTRDFIENALPLFDENYAAVQGRYIASNRSFNFVTRMLALEGDLWSTPFMTIRSHFGRRTPLGGTGYIVRKDILTKVGMFANHLVDDYELTFRLLRNGYRIAFAPLSVNYDEKPPTLSFMLRQRARWGKGFIDLLSTRVAEGPDIIGHIYWLNPLAAICGLIMLMVPAFAAIHYLIYDYYPYTYAYIPLSVWFAFTGVLFALQAAVLVREYGRRGLVYAAQIPALTPFSHYWFVSFMKAFTIKSWANTKTMHGFMKEAKMVSDAS
ncbi:MAG: glycosyltransferase family 2 protein [Nitrososphaera sp.]|jgi:cellulose synthase/poly-beta-1,6-N-acetylglucosamine synthase-like glycosyltransferase